MHKPLLTVKPSLINALLPSYAKNFLVLSVFLLPVYLLLTATPRLMVSSTIINHLNLFALLIIIAILALMPLSFQIIMLINTTYYFYENRALSEYKLFVVKRYSAPYRRIVNMKVKIGLWDRVCGTGTLVLYTAEDVHPDLEFRYLKNPLVIEKKVTTLMHNYYETHTKSKMA